MTTHRQQKLLVIQDLSCIGRCSLTVALPVLSCLGVQAVPLPTALLSAHTAFDGVYRRDMLEDMREIADRWAQMPLSFDGVYVGYLGGGHQLPLVMKLVERYQRGGTRLFVDPVMGDHGKPYSFVTAALREGFALLCKRAEVIFPNRTEASMLLGVEYKEAGGEEDILRRLTQGFAPAAVLTGVARGQELGTMCLSEGRIGGAYAARHPGSFPGTGDLLASAAIGALLRGLPLEKALDLAVRFVSGSIAWHEQGQDSRLGVPFERQLPSLMRDVQQMLDEGVNNLNG